MPDLPPNPDLPPIDIADPDRIRSLLADPRNYGWRAIDSEQYDGWTADLGLTGYDEPSLVRLGRSARSEAGASLSHRFWDTGDGRREAAPGIRRDHRGRRHVGVVLYATAGEAFALEFHLGHERLGGWVAPRRDNRRHLLVLDRPVQFLGEMEVFRVVATGTGSHRIEAFVLLAERPEPDAFAPGLLEIQTRWPLDASGFGEREGVRGRGDGRDGDGEGEGCEALVLTRRPARVAASGPDGMRVESPVVGRLHRLALPASWRGGDAVMFVAEDADDARLPPARREVRLPARRGPIVAEAVAVAAVQVLADPRHAGLPLRFGVPLAAGRLGANVGDTTLRVADGAVVPCDARTLSRWPDGSARWVLLETTCPPLPGPSQAEVRFGAGGDAVAGSTAREDEPAEVAIEHRDDGGVVVSGRRVRVEVGPEGLALIAAGDEREPVAGDWPQWFDVALGHGLPLSPRLERIAVESAGRRRVTLRIDVSHDDAGGAAHLRSALWLEVFAEQAFVAIAHRLEVISPMLAPACGGKADADPRFDAARPAIAGVAHEEPAMLTLRRFVLRLPRREDGCDGAEGLAPWRLLVEHDRGHRVGAPERLRRVEGVPVPQPLALRGGVVAAVRDLWQNYPKGLRRDADGSGAIELLPELPEDFEIPGDDAERIALAYWIRGGRYWLKAGLALGNDLVVGFAASADEAARWQAWLDEPPRVRPDPGHTLASGATVPFAPKDDSPLPRYETLADDALDSLLQDRRRHRAFGQLNFGDWYGESGWSWGNNEYDGPLIGYLEFLRGGRAGWAALAAQAARHLADVDTVNFSRDRSHLGMQAMHVPGHLGGYYPPLFRSKVAGTVALPSHTWVEGPLLHWLLSGDAAVRESLDRTKRWLLAPRWFDAYEVSNAREAGWHLIHLCAFVSADDDPHCLLAARVIVDRVLERQVPGGGWEHNLVEAHCGCGYPRCRGEAGFMVGVLLAGLKRYHALTSRGDVADAIVGGARWLVRRTFDAASGHFRYTACPHRGRAPNAQYTQWVLDGLADACALGGDEEIGAVLRRSLAAVGEVPQDVTHLGLGKALAQQMRYVPTLLATLRAQRKSHRPPEGAAGGG
jgi:hypothetical protein